jgi:hypothetical protein
MIRRGRATPPAILAEKFPARLKKAPTRGRKESAGAVLARIDKLVTEWREDRVDGSTETLLYVDNELNGYYGRKVDYFKGEEP